jgi:4-amino-4-deoxy-L-arabinose transferase-like glycosyltransferase
MEHSDGQNAGSIVDRGKARSGANRGLHLAQVVFVLFCAETLFSLPYRSVYLLRQSASQAWIAALFVLVMICACFAFRQPVLRALGSLLSAPSIGNKAWLSFWLIFGLALRLAWALRFPVTLKSDNLIYFDVAAKMAHGQSIVSVFNPPGLSLFLAPFFMVVGTHTWVPLLCALLLFIATYLLTYALAARIQGSLAARIATMLVAIWPSYFTLVGVNSKETLLAALVPATLYFYLKACDPKVGLKEAHIHWGYVIAAGICMGFAALTQPGYLLFPCVLFGFEMLRDRGLLKAAVRITVFSIAMLASIAPWTIRNYLVFHRTVLISTNGGSVFYRANNPNANAQYEPENAAPLSKDEFEADKQGYKMAEDWIVHNPGAFAVLMVRKQVVFLGDDAVGVFETLKFHIDHPVPLYAPAKAISNLFWLVLWTVLFFGFPLLFKPGNWRLWYGLLFLPFLYQWAIDSVFESGPRHHVPYVALLAVLAGMVLSSTAQQKLHSNE